MAVGGVGRGMTAGDRVEGIVEGRVRVGQVDRVRVGQVDRVRRGRRTAGRVRRENAGGHGRKGRRGEIVRRGTAGNSEGGQGGRVRRDRSIIVGRVHHSGRGLRRWKAGKRVSWPIRGLLRQWHVRSRRRAGPILFSMWRGCFCRIGHGTW